PRRLLRRLAEPTRHEALPREPPPHHRGVRSSGEVGLVLHRRSAFRPVRPRHASARSDPPLRLSPPSEGILLFSPACRPRRRGPRQRAGSSSPWREGSFAPAATRGRSSRTSPP